MMDSETYLCEYCEEMYEVDEMNIISDIHEPNMCIYCCEKIEHKRWRKDQQEQQRRRNESFYKGLES